MDRMDRMSRMGVHLDQKLTQTVGTILVILISRQPTNITGINPLTAKRQPTGGATINEFNFNEKLKKKKCQNGLTVRGLDR